MKWEDGPSSFLLKLYRESFRNVGPMKTFRNKKHMWLFLSEQINSKFNLSVTPLQVETRFRCVMKRRKNAIDNNQTSGSEYIEPEFEEEINEIISVDDSIIPERITTPGQTIEKHGSKTIKKISRPPLNYSPIIESRPRTSSEGSSTRDMGCSKSRPRTNSGGSSSNDIPSTSRSRTCSESSTSHSDYCSEQSTSERNIDSEIVTDSEASSPAPKKRIKKSVQEIVCDKFLAVQAEKHKMILELAKEKAARKEQRAKEIREDKERRHKEKMELLAEFIKNVTKK